MPRTSPTTCCRWYLRPRWPTMLRGARRRATRTRGTVEPAVTSDPTEIGQRRDDAVDRGGHDGVVGVGHRIVVGLLRRLQVGVRGLNALLGAASRPAAVVDTLLCARELALGDRDFVRVVRRGGWLALERVEVLLRLDLLGLGRVQLVRSPAASACLACVWLCFDCSSDASRLEELRLDVGARDRVEVVARLSPSRRDSRRASRRCR